jgi:hypothetical protein
MAKNDLAISQEPTFTLQDVLVLMQQMNEAADARAMAQTKFLAEELRKPTAEQAEKLEKERLQRIRNAKAEAEQAKLDERFRNGQKEFCSHVKQDKSTRWGGQVGSDGCVRFHCNNCHDILPPVKAPIEWIQNGVNCHSPEDVAGAMRFITKNQIIGWHKADLRDGRQKGPCDCKYCNQIPVPATIPEQQQPAVSATV